MQFKIFTIPVENSEHYIEELNYFLRVNKVVDVRKESVNSNGSCYWTFCVTYLPQSTSPIIQERSQRQKIDYKNVLSSEAFNKFSAMRKIRKEIAEEEAVPPYAVFTDAELSMIAELEEITPKAIENIKGIGGKRVEKYGERISEALKQINDELDEASGTSDRENSGTGQSVSGVL